MPESEWHALYVVELDNVRTALDWAIDPGGDPSLGVALAGASGAIWTALSLRSEGAQRLEAAAGRIEPAMPATDQARLWLWLGILLQDTAPIKAALAFEQAGELFRRPVTHSGPPMRNCASPSLSRDWGASTMRHMRLRRRTPKSNARVCPN